MQRTIVRRVGLSDTSLDGWRLPHRLRYGAPVVTVQPLVGFTETRPQRSLLAAGRGTRPGPSMGLSGRRRPAPLSPGARSKDCSGTSILWTSLSRPGRCANFACWPQLWTPVAGAGPLAARIGRKRRWQLLFGRPDHLAHRQCQRAVDAAGAQPGSWSGRLDWGALGESAGRRMPSAISMLI